MSNFQKISDVLHISDQQPIEERPYREVHGIETLDQSLDYILGPHTDLEHRVIKKDGYTLSLAKGVHVIGGLEHEYAKYPLLQPCYYPTATILVKEDKWALVGPPRYRSNHFAFSNLGKAKEPTDESQKELNKLNPSIDAKYFATGHHYAGGQGYLYKELKSDGGKQILQRVCGEQDFEKQQYPFPLVHVSERGIKDDSFYMDETFDPLTPQPLGVTDHHYMVAGSTPEELENLGIEILLDDELIESFRMSEAMNTENEFTIPLNVNKSFKNLTVRVYRSDGVIEINWSGDIGNNLNFFMPGVTEEQRLSKNQRTYDRQRFETSKKNLEKAGVKSKIDYEDLAAKGLKTDPKELLYLLAIEPSDGMHTVNDYKATDKTWSKRRKITKTIKFIQY